MLCMFARQIQKNHEPLGSALCRVAVFFMGIWLGGDLADECDVNNAPYRQIYSVP